MMYLMRYRVASATNLRNLNNLSSGDVILQNIETGTVSIEVDMGLVQSLIANHEILNYDYEKDVILNRMTTYYEIDIGKSKLIHSGGFLYFYHKGKAYTNRIVSGVDCSLRTAQHMPLSMLHFIVQDGNKSYTIGHFGVKENLRLVGGIEVKEQEFKRHVLLDWHTSIS